MSLLTTSRNSQTGLLHICLLLQSLATVCGFAANLREAAVQPAALRTTRRLSPRRRPRWRADRAAGAQIPPACGLAPPVSETDVPCRGAARGTEGTGGGRLTHVGPPEPLHQQGHHHGHHGRPGPGVPMSLEGTGSIYAGPTSGWFSLKHVLCLL